MVKVNLSSFSSTTKLSGGHNGLDKRKGKKSKASIAGSNLSNGLLVEVHDVKPTNNTMQWTGTTTDVSDDGTSCTVELTEKKDKKAHHVSRLDDATTVSVTVGDSDPLNSDTFVGTT